MPMVTPYESRAGIATANAGQAASYRSASAFMTPGQQALPGALNQLARGLDRFGGAVHELLLDRQRMQNATDLLADKVAYEDALREFDSNYRQTRQGVSARTAEEDYNAFHQEQYEKLQRKWGGNPFLMEGVNRMAAGIREPSMSRAVSYRDQQEKQYQQSVLAASRAQTLQLFGDPSVPWDEKMAALEGEENNARLFAGQRREVIDGQEQWTGGNDVTAEVMALRQSLFREHLDGLIAAGNLGAAERLLNTADALRRGEEGGADSVWSCIPARYISEARLKIQSRQDALAARAEARRKKAEAAAEEARIEQGYQDVMSGVSEFPSIWTADERMAKVVELTADMDPGVRAAVRKRARADIDERELVRKAGLTQELGMVDRVLEANPQYTSNEKIRIIRESNISDDAKAAAIQELEREREGKGNEKASAAGLRMFRAMYDERFGSLSETEAQALMFDLNLNARDRQAAQEYGGRGLEYSQSRIDGLIDSVLGKDTKDGKRSQLYAALMKRVPAGESWDDKRLKREIYLLEKGGESGWRGKNLAERVLNNEEGRFRPDIPTEMQTLLNRELEEAYPFFTSAPEKARKLMRQAVWLRRQYGIAPEWTDEELKLLRSVGVK